MWITFDSLKDFVFLACLLDFTTGYRLLRIVKPIPAQMYPPVIEYGAARIKLPCDSLRDKRVTLCILVLLWAHRRVNLKGVPLYTDVTSVYFASHAVARSKYQTLESSSFLDHLLFVAPQDPRETCRRHRWCISIDLLFFFSMPNDFILLRAALNGVH